MALVYCICMNVIFSPPDDSPARTSRGLSFDKSFYLSMDGSGHTGGEYIWTGSPEPRGSGLEKILHNFQLESVKYS